MAVSAGLGVPAFPTATISQTAMPTVKASRSMTGTIVGLGSVAESGTMARVGVEPGGELLRVEEHAGVEDPAGVEGGLGRPQVGHVEEGAPPGVGGGVPAALLSSDGAPADDGAAAVVGAALQGPGEREVDRVGGRLEADEEDGLVARP